MDNWTIRMCGDLGMRSHVKIVALDVCSIYLFVSIVCWVQLFVCVLPQEHYIINTFAELLHTQSTLTFLA